MRFECGFGGDTFSDLNIGTNIQLDRDLNLGTNIQLDKDLNIGTMI